MQETHAAHLIPRPCRFIAPSPFTAPRAPRAARRAGRRGLTLVEVAIVVAVVAVTGSLAVQRVHRHLAYARSAEAVQTVGAITRALVHTFAVKNHDNKASGVKQTGGGSKGKGAVVTFDPGLCRDAPSVPANINSVKRRKYQPRNSPGKDYNSGSPTAGWKCIGFQNDQPQYYQYSYKLGGPPITVQLPGGGSPNGAAGGGMARQWSVYARGDVDGDNKLSWFIMKGYTIGEDLTIASGIAIQDQEE